MAEVSGLSAVSPADRHVVGNTTDCLKRTNGSLSFRGLLLHPSRSGIPARGPTGPAIYLAPPQTSSDGPVRPSQGRARREPDTAGEADSMEPPPATQGLLLDPLFCQLAMNHGPSSFVQSDPSALVAPAL